MGSVDSARNEHIQNKIKPALAQGKWVVSDRFTDASFAYQGGGRSLDLKRIEALETWVQGEFRPDLTLLLDLNVDIGMARIEVRLTKDRIEKEERAFFERVRQVFIDRSQQYPQRIKLVDASVGVDEVSQQIHTYLEQL